MAKTKDDAPKIIYANMFTNGFQTEPSTANVEYRYVRGEIADGLRDACEKVVAEHDCFRLDILYKRKKPCDCIVCVAKAALAQGS